MSNLSDNTLPIFIRVVDATITILKKGEAHCQSNGIEADTWLDLKLIDDMAGMPFQVSSVAHHSRGAINGMLKGEFNPPPPFKPESYGELIEHIEQASAELKSVEASNIDALTGQHVLFKVGDFEISFTAENFAQSFSLPNLMFHATTVYNLLRKEGVKLGKQDFLGAMAVGYPA